MTQAVLFEGGSVFSAGFERSIRSDLLVVDGRIVAVGTAAELVERLRAEHPGAGLERVDLGGGLLLPGFQDAHVHPVPAGVEMLQCDLSEAESAGEALAVVRAYAEGLGPVGAGARTSAGGRSGSGSGSGSGDWVLGGGWTMDHFAGGTPTAAALDTVTGDRPAFLLSRDHHSAWVNSAALRLAGLSAATPAPADGAIERLADGTPSGTLHEGAMGLIDAVKPAPDAELVQRGLLAAQTHLLSLGITGWQDALVGAGLGFVDALPHYLRAVREGSLVARVTAALWWERTEGLEQVPRLLARRAEAAALGRPELFTADTVKMMLDGIVENRTASIHGHYHGGGNGLDFVDPAALADFVARLDAEGFAVHLHALGDRAVSQALDALAHAASVNGRASGTLTRHQLAHLQLVAEADLARFAPLGAIANLQAFWARTDDQLRDLCLPILPPDALGRTYPFGRLARAGAPLAFGSDWPVSTADPLAAVQVAVTRTGFGAEPEPLGGTVDRLDLATALAGYTVGSAHAGGRGGSTGRLEPGFHADLAVLDRDPFAGPVEDIAEA
ncbi:MAG: amidohydrolase, partial [Herbiconiux sp.]|nr:amidohydrolase [Herbiconiux sp.]